MKKALLLVTCFGLSISAYAGRPKIGPGFTPGIGEGNTTGGGSKTEVTLPVGLPLNGGDSELPANSDPSSSSNIVYTFDLSEGNGAASVNQTHSAFEKARNMNAACVLIRINSFAGGWDVAENIRQEILEYDRPVMVYVNDQAVSAASFISSGADSIYTKKGSTISNKKSARNNTLQTAIKKQINEEQGLLSNISGNTSARPQTEMQQYGNDVTMKEILYKAGLSNLTVVEHDAGFSEKCVTFLTNPWAIIALLVLTGFVLRKSVSSRIPGPMMYGIALVLLFAIAPFQLAGLASGYEIGLTILLSLGLLVSGKKNMRMINGLLIVALGLSFTLIRFGDVSALVAYGPKTDLLIQMCLSLVCLVSGWLIGRIGKQTSSVTGLSKSQAATPLQAAA